MAITDEMICLGRDDSDTAATLGPNGLVGGHSHQGSPMDGVGDAHGLSSLLYMCILYITGSARSLGTAWWLKIYKTWF